MSLYYLGIRLLLRLIGKGLSVLLKEEKTETVSIPDYGVFSSWECPACGSWNKPSKGICKACGKGKPRNCRTAEYAVALTWKCPKCGTWNPFDKEICENCGESKPRKKQTMK